MQKVRDARDGKPEDIKEASGGEKSSEKNSLLLEMLNRIRTHGIIW